MTIRLPSHSIVNSFVSRFKDAYSALQERETIRPFWKPFSHPIFFSYHNELLRQYSYIVVSGAGSPDVNGKYYPIGMLNDAFVWENKQHMFLSREYIDNQFGWIFGNMRTCYYGIDNPSSFPPDQVVWRCYSGKDPAPQLHMHLGGECQSVFDLRNQVATMQKVFRWTRDLELQVLYFISMSLTSSHSLCEELFFSERFYAQNLHLALDIFHQALSGPHERSRSASGSPHEPALRESSAHALPS